MKKNIYGMERLKKGLATVTKDPVQKGDQLELNEWGEIARIMRNDKPLYWLGQKIGWTTGAEDPRLRHFAGEAGCLPAAGDEIVVLHLTVEQSPGYIDQEDVEREGFESKEAFSQAFAAAYGPTSLWRAAWRIRCGVNKIILEPTSHDPAPQATGTGVVTSPKRPDASRLEGLS